MSLCDQQASMLFRMGQVVSKPSTIHDLGEPTSPLMERNKLEINGCFLHTTKVDWWLLSLLMDVSCKSNLIPSQQIVPHEKRKTDKTFRRKLETKIQLYSRPVPVVCMHVQRSMWKPPEFMDESVFSLPVIKATDWLPSQARTKPTYVHVHDSLHHTDAKQSRGISLCMPKQHHVRYHLLGDQLAKLD